MKSDAPKAVVLMSGGMDSCVTAALASRSYRIAALHASYGQLTEGRELESFNKLADHFLAFARLTVRLDYFRAIGGSSLTDPRLAIHNADLSNDERSECEPGRAKPVNHERSECEPGRAKPVKKDIPNTYVPFRNAHFLSIATSWAEVVGATKIFIGAVWEDSSGYPDCRPAYYDAFNKVIQLGTKPATDITVETPLIYLSKRDIVKQGVELGAPLDLTWSCYRNSDLACGVCDSCALRLRAFQAAGLDDPIAYATKPEYARI